MKAGNRESGTGNRSRRSLKSNQSPPLLLTNIGQLLTLRGGDGPRRGREMRELAIVEDAAVLCVGGHIVSVGTGKEAVRDGWVKQHKADLVELDCQGGVV